MLWGKGDQMEWFWPNKDQLNDYPDPIGFESEWEKWAADLADSPSVVAEIFAREYIQNSVDSIRRQNDLLSDLEQPAIKNPSINFRFINLKGDALKKFIAASGVDVLRSRYRSMTSDEQDLSRLSNSDWLSQDVQPESLTLLVCSEVGGIGMFGHWWTQGDKDRSDSLLKLALIQTQSQKGSAVSGGSWGHGKKAIANASKSRSILVYTCFLKPALPKDDDNGLTRRAIGVAYWKSHVDGQKSCQGLGILGQKIKPNEEWINNFIPLGDDGADTYVKSFGLADVPVRYPTNPQDCGSTYIIVEPAFDSSQLRGAIERNWWPLIYKNSIKVSLTDEQLNPVIIAPESQDSLVPFKRAYEIALGQEDPKEYESRVGVVHVTHEIEGRIESGLMGLTSDIKPGGWSYSDEDGAATLIALVRGDMVIAYQQSPALRSRPPFLRGAFVVDAIKHIESAKILRLTEPHLHNKWRTEDADDVTREGRKFAKGVLDRIHKEVKDLREKMRGVRVSVDAQFRPFTDIFRDGNRGVTGPIEPRVPRLFSIQYPEGVKRIPGSSGEKLSLKATCKIGLRDNAKNPPPDRMAVRVFLAWSVLEDGLNEDETLFDVTSVITPKGFKLSKEDGSYIGELIKGREVEFTWTSNNFSLDWSVAPTPRVEPVTS